jgi:deoxyribose-phosphate aldolase
MMINVGRLRSGHHGIVQEDIRAVVAAAGPVPVKVIIEAPYLSEDEIKKACEMCIAGGAAFVKTSTGWVPNGSSLEMIRLITSFVGGAIKVKAAGAVRDLETVARMLGMGVARFGINMNSAMDLVRQVSALPGGVLEV